MNRAQQRMFTMSRYFITRHVDYKDGTGKDSLGHITLIHMDLAKNHWENTFIFFTLVCLLALRTGLMSNLLN